MHRSPLALLVVCLAPFSLQLAACGRAPVVEPVAIRLTDTFDPRSIRSARSVQRDAAPLVEWRFDRPSALQGESPPSSTQGWRVGAGVSALAIRERRLSGRTTDDLPVIYVERTAGPFDADLLHAVEIRVRVPEGGELAVSFEADEKVDLAKVLQNARDFPWETKTPLLPGNESRTYSLTPRTPVASSEIRHVFVRPTDKAGRTFEIESLRLIFRKEHLASIASGVSWQGLDGMYFESLVSRAPEVFEMDLMLPSNPWLDLSVGTVEDGPVTFRVSARVPEDGNTPSEGRMLLERTVTAPHRWETTPIDLRGFSGRRLRLAFSLGAERAGAVGFWGAPVVRNVGVMPVEAPRRGEQGSSLGRPQGIILIWADTLRSDHLEVYGYGRPTAPTIRRLAAEGTLFRNAVSQATWTKVATPSLMTSLYPTSHGVRGVPDRIPASATTIAEVLRNAGYATLSFASNGFTGQNTNLHQGFEQVHEETSLPDRRSSKTMRIGLDRVLPWLEAHRDVPFFVFMSILDPHDPYKPYPPYDTLWADPAAEKEHVRQTEHARKFIKTPILRLFGMPSRDELVEAGVDPVKYVAHDRDWYDGSIRGMDAEVGRLLERLRSLALDRKTLVLFTSDHGEEFMEHGRMFHGQSTYGELSRVPLIMWGPGLIPRGVVDETVETIDIVPTLLEISRLRAPEAMQGQSLVPLLPTSPSSSSGSTAGAETAVTAQQAAQSGRWQRRPAIVEKWSEPEDKPPLDTDSFAIISDGWKLVHNAKRHPGTPEYELYDFVKDPLDSVDVAAQQPQVVARLRKALDGWRQFAAARRVLPDTEASKILDAEQLQRLKALGYIK
jgi:arylsulfatase A-like enzyme